MLIKNSIKLLLLMLYASYFQGMIGYDCVAYGTFKVCIMRREKINKKQILMLCNNTL